MGAAIEPRVLSKGPVPGHLVALSVPVATAMVLHSVYAVVDLAFVGRLGESAVAGLSISLQAFFLVLAISQVVATAVLARVSHDYGSGRIEQAWRAFSGYLGVAFGIGSIAAVTAFFSAPLYVSTFTDDPEVIRHGLAYFKITSLTFLSQLLLMVIGTGLRASGDFKSPMRVVFVSVAINLVLDPVMIFGLGPVPAMGLVGAAWATVIAQVVALSVYARQLLRRPPSPRALRWAPPALSRTMVVEIFTRGLPAGLQYFLLSVVLGIILVAMKPHGPVWTAAAGGGFRILQQTILPLVALGFAASALAGQNLGAGLPRRIVATAATAMRWGCTYAVVLGGLLWLGADLAGRIFAQTDVELAAASTYFRWSAPTTLAFAMSLVPTMLLQGVGRSVMPLMGAILKLIVLCILVFMVVPLYGLSPKWVFGASTVAYLFEGVADVWMLRVWLKRLPMGSAASDGAEPPVVFV